MGDLEGLADVKLWVAAVVSGDGLLGLNADDAQLGTKAQGLTQRFSRRPPLGWFALDADVALLREHRARGGSTCGGRGGRLCLHYAGGGPHHGPISATPLPRQ